MTIQTPWGLVFKAVAWTWHRVTKVLFHKTYYEAHARWAKRNRLGARWEKIGEYVEYSLRLAQPTDVEPRLSKVTFRAVNTTVKKFERIFESEGAGIRYQDVIDLRDLNRSPIVINLRNTPSQNFLSHFENDIRFSVESYQFRRCLVELEDDQISWELSSLTAYLGHDWLLNDTWNCRWGVFWNCNSITFAKREIEIYWRWRVGYHEHHYSVSSNRNTPSRRCRFLRKTIIWLLSNPWALTAQFWVAIWSKLFLLDENDRLRRI